MTSKTYAQAGATVALSATTTSSNAAIFGPCNTVRVLNVGTVATHIAFGVDPAMLATTADLPVGPNESRVVYKGGATRVAALAATGTATIYFTPVE